MVWSDLECRRILYLAQNDKLNHNLATESNVNLLTDLESSALNTCVPQPLRKEVHFVMALIVNAHLKTSHKTTQLSPTDS